MTLDEFMQNLVKPNTEAEQSSDYEGMAFDAGVNYAVREIMKFLGSETKEQKVSLSEYLKVLNTLSNSRKDENPDEETSWEESGYQLALYDVKEYLENDEIVINRTLEEYKELED